MVCVAVIILVAIIIIIQLLILLIISLLIIVVITFLHLVVIPPLLGALGRELREQLAASAREHQLVALDHLVEEIH